MIIILLINSRLKDNEEAIYEACKRDIGKPSFETYVAELGWCQNDIIFMQNNLEKWVKDEAAPDIPLMNKLASPRIRKDPLGAVLIIGYAREIIQLLYTSQLSSGRITY